MKLIIDISKEKLNDIKNKMYCGIYDSNLYKAIANGTPLDDVKAEIEAKEMVETDTERQFYNMALDDVNKILDNIDKEESKQYYACSTCKFVSMHCTRYDGDVAATVYCGNWEGEV